MIKTFLGYIRKSIIEGETASPARQRAAIERRVKAAYPDARIEWYEDLDLSGRHESNRPGWQRLLSDLEAGDGDGVAVESYDRSHRNVREFLSFYDDVLAPAGRTLISATQNLDLSTADGRAMATVLLAFAEMEARKGSERMRATLQHIRSEGRHHGGIPFGCDRDPITKHLIPAQTAYLYNPATGEARPDAGDPPPGFERRFFHDTLRIIYETYAAGDISLTDTAIQLNAAGWRHWKRDRKTPVEFGGNTTRSVIRHWPIYAGQLPSEMGQQVGNRKNPPQFVQANFPPILPVELCEAAGAALKSRIARGGPKGKSQVYLLGGLAFCGACGCRLCGQSQPNGNRYYRHNNIKKECVERMPRADEIHADIIELVGELAGELVDRVAAELRRLEAEIKAREAGSAGEIERKRAEMERLISLHIKDLITEDEFKRHRAALQAEIDQLQPEAGNNAGIGEILGQLETLLADFEAGEPALQKEVIRSLFERVEIQDQQVSRVVPQAWVAGLFYLRVDSGLDRGLMRRQHTLTPAAG